MRLTIPATAKQIAMWPLSYMRMSPSFIIIGAQRCGTTSLYNYLEGHPLIAPAARKEIHFFDKNFEKGIAWYRSQFPTIVHRYRVERVLGHRPVTGEATPYYIFHPLAPRRLSLLFPDAKLIVMLRNPVDRAYSHYHHEVGIGAESLPFERALECEKDRLHLDDWNLRKSRCHSSFRHQHFSYLARGVYVDQLETLANLFSKDQILTIKSEQFYAEPSFVFQQVLDFLNLPAWEPEEYRAYNQSAYLTMDPSLRKRLSGYFRPHNERLYSHLGQDFGWDS